MKKHNYLSPSGTCLEVMFGSALLAGSVDGVSNESVSGTENDFASDWLNI